MLKNMKIAQRLILTFVVAVLICSLAGILGVTLLNKSDVDYSNALVNYGFAQGDIGNLGRHFQNQRATTLFVLTASDEKMRNSYLQELNTLDQTMDVDMEKVNKSLGTELGQQTYAKLSAALQEYRSTRSEVFALLSTTSSDKIVPLYREKCGKAATEMASVIDTMLSDKTRIGLEKSIGLTSQTNLFTIIIVAVMVTSFIAALLFAIITAKAVSEPVRMMEQAAQRLAKGDFDVEIPYESRNEIGSLAHSMRIMISTTKDIIKDTDRGLSEIANGNFDISPRIEYIGIFKKIETSIWGIISKLSNTMNQISTASEQVSVGADQVSGGSQALSQGATEQASSVEELSATISEISMHVRENAASATDASNKVSAVGNQIVASNSQMHDMISAMAEISTASSEIGKVIKTIEDIAFQTNILALNAAVEAARAGVAGKGFAVVADEVRNLASKSAEAAKGTTSLIEGSIKAVENGTRIADETARSLELTVESSKTVAQIVNNIAVASNEQANSIHQVTIGIDQISSVVQTNSATAQQSAAASEELNGQAQMLKELMSLFHLNSKLIDTPHIQVPSHTPIFINEHEHSSVASKY